jgi:hypothetical protein
VRVCTRGRAHARTTVRERRRVFARAPACLACARVCARAFRARRDRSFRARAARRAIFDVFGIFSFLVGIFSFLRSARVCVRVCVCACACAFLRAALKNASIAHAHLCVRVFCARPFCARCASKTQIWPPRNAARKRRRRGAPRPHTHSPAQPGALRGAQATFSPKAQKWPAKLASGT